jgi:hypothetical protein
MEVTNTHLVVTSANKTELGFVTKASSRNVALTVSAAGEQG